MKKYRLNRFVHSQRLNDKAYLITNFENSAQILLSNEMFHSIDETAANFTELNLDSDLFTRLITGGFILEEHIDELKRVLEKRTPERCDRNQYHIIVNPTLDCNLNCWYCYENKISGSQMTETVMNAIVKNYSHHYSLHPYKVLKLSFFGGEPFMKPHVVRFLVTKASDFCKKNGVELFLDFTTNGTLFSTSLLNFLSSYTCQFQITLDGNETQHNKIKYFANRNGNPFETTVKNIHRIQEMIPNSHMYVRINFDENTLKDFENIVDKISDLDRKRTTIIMKKIWQVNEKGIDKSLITNAIHSLLVNSFIIDYYGQGGWCFADMDNQVTINYDGGIFKCTTISHFDESESLGDLNLETGEIIWDNEKTAYLHDERISDNCLACKMLPKCGGPCRRQMSRGLKSHCFLNDQGITMDDFALIHMHINYIKSKVYG